MRHRQGYPRELDRQELAFLVGFWLRQAVDRCEDRNREGVRRWPFMRCSAGRLRRLELVRPDGAVAGFCVQNQQNPGSRASDVHLPIEPSSK